MEGMLGKRGCLSGRRRHQSYHYGILARRLVVRGIGVWSIRSVSPGPFYVLIVLFSRGVFKKLG